MLNGVFEAGMDAMFIHEMKKIESQITYWRDRALKAEDEYVKIRAHRDQLLALANDCHNTSLKEQERADHNYSVASSLRASLEKETARADKNYSVATNNKALFEKESARANKNYDAGKRLEKSLGEANKLNKNLKTMLTRVSKYLYVLGAAYDAIVEEIEQAGDWQKYSNMRFASREALLYKEIERVEGEDFRRNEFCEGIYYYPDVRSLPDQKPEDVCLLQVTAYDWFPSLGLDA
jgi:hypothetical protein